jgi:hypothetical protein
MLGFIIALVIRIIVPFYIFKSPFWGMVASEIADSIDVFILQIVDPGFSGLAYQNFDKIMDLYMIFFAAVYSFKFERIVTITSWVMFSWRALGVLLFTITGMRWLIVLFPGILDFFFLFCAGRARYFPKFTITKKNLWWIILVLLIPKFAQESFLHYFGGDQILWALDLKILSFFGL